MTYDVIVRNGLWFDGTGAAPQVRTLGIRVPLGGLLATIFVAFIGAIVLLLLIRLFRRLKAA